jgi:hypothetical protein
LVDGLEGTLLGLSEHHVIPSTVKKDLAWCAVILMLPILGAVLGGDMLLVAGLGLVSAVAYLVARRDS